MYRFPKYGGRLLENKSIINWISNNIDIIDFDAALACYYEDFRVHDMVRIYTESISLDLLKQIKAEYDKHLTKLNK